MRPRDDNKAAVLARLGQDDILDQTIEAALADEMGLDMLSDIALQRWADAYERQPPVQRPLNPIQAALFGHPGKGH